MRKLKLFLSLLVLVTISIGNVWAADPTSVTINFGTTENYWAAHTNSTFTDSAKRQWACSWTAGGKSSGQAGYSQFGNSSNACTDFVLTVTAGSDISVSAFSVTVAGASGSSSPTTGRIYLYKRTSSGTETQLATDTINGTSNVTCSIASAVTFASTDILKVSYVGTAKAIRISQLSYTYSAAAANPSVTLTPDGTTDYGTQRKGNNPDSRLRINLTGANLKSDITVTVPDGFLAYTGSESAAASFTISPTDGAIADTTIFVKMDQSASAGVKDDSLVVTGGGLTAAVKQAMKLTIIESTITLDPEEPNLAFGNEIVKGASVDAKTFDLYGTDLTDDDVTVAAPEGFLVSIGDADPAESLTITPDEEAIAETIIVTPVTTTAGEFNGNITISGGGLDPNVTIPVSMTVLETYAISAAEVANGSFSWTAGGVASATPVLAGTSVVATATPASEDYVLDSWDIYYMDGEKKAVSHTDGAFAMPAFPVTISGSFRLATAPSLNASKSALDFGEVDINSEPEGLTFTLTGANLTEDISLLTGNENTAFTLSKTSLTKEEVMAEGGVTITVTPKPTYAGTITNKIYANWEQGMPKIVDLSMTVNKLAAGLEWSAEEATVTIDAEDNDFPTLTNSHSLAIVYSGNADGVATINAETGDIELVGPGDVTITAATEGNATYAAQTVSYTLHVQKLYTATWYVNGVSKKTQKALPGTALETAPEALATGDCADLFFQGWAEAPLAEAQDEAPTYTTTTEMPSEDVNFYAVFATKGVKVIEGDPEWVATDTASLATNDSIVIVGNNGSNYAMSNDKGTSAAPTAVSVSIANGKLSAAPAANIKWKFVKNGSNNYSFTTGTDSLYCTNDNNGIRVGNKNTATAFSLTDAYLCNIAASRYAGIYNSADWRCYTSINNNIKNQTFTFFKKTASKQEQVTYSGYLTTCPHCSVLELVTNDPEEGEIVLKVGGVEVESVKTCEAVTVDVVASPATGYELSGIELEGAKDGVTYNEGILSIPEGATGTLGVLATFSAINYTVTMAQTGDASATLSEDQANVHYGDQITVSTNEPAGFAFLGWTASPAVEFADAKALETTFDLPNGNVTVTAQFAKLYTVAEAQELIDADKEATHPNSVVEGYVAGNISYSSKFNSLTYNIQAIDANGFLTGKTIKVYSGKGLNNANFTSTDDIAVGAKVRVIGELMWYGSESVYEINYNNYLLSYDEGSYTGVEIYGEASNKAYEKGEAFSFAGLNAKDVWDNGYSEAITFANVNWTATPATVEADGNVSVTAKYDDNTSEAKIVAVTVKLHKVTFADPANGTLLVLKEINEETWEDIDSGDEFPKGTVLHIKVAAEKGYKLEKVTIDGETLAPVDDEYSITIGTADVTIAAIFDVATALDNTEAEVKTVKFIENGQIFILRGEKVYTITGELVK